MKKEKLSLKSIKKVLNRTEMKKIMAGGSSGCDDFACGSEPCRFFTDGVFVCSSCCA